MKQEITSYIGAGILIALCVWLLYRYATYA
jgi:hypothetical protein